MALFNRKEQQDPVLDLREPAPAPQQFGYPTLCPECKGPGYLDSIDLSRRLMYQHCPACMAKWQTTEDELVSH